MGCSGLHDSRALHDAPAGRQRPAGQQRCSATPPRRFLPNTIHADASGPPPVPVRSAGAANTSPEGATCKSADAKNSNVWLAWGPVAARALQADHQTLGWSASLLNIYRYT